jgi:hypothetical protein
MNQEAMKQALCVYLDAFENHRITNSTSSNLDMTGHIAELARAAIAEVEKQEPVAWRHLAQYKDGEVWTYTSTRPTDREVVQPLYTAPRSVQWAESQAQHWKEHAKDLMKKLMEKNT